MESELELPKRKAIKRALRDCGLSDRQTDALLRDGWKSLVGATKAEADELREALADLTKNIKN